MNLKTLIILSIFFLFGNSVYAQAEMEAKAAYLLAEESYGKGDYQSTLRYLAQAKKSLGKSNSKILYLQIQAEMEIAKGNSQATDRLLALVAEFEGSPDIKSFNEEKILEVTKLKLVLKAQKEDLAERIRNTLNAKTDSIKKANDSKQRGASLGGIIVYEKDGHGLIVAEADLKKGNFSQARNFCDDLVLNGFDDWYLPDVNELMLIYQNVKLKGLSQFDADFYWSSEKGFLRWGFSFASGGSAKLGTLIKYNVRPVRKF